MDLQQILKMADPITVSEDSFIKNEVEDVSPVDSEKLFHFPNHLLSPRREDVPLFNLPSISGPCKFEYDTQESKCSNNEDVEDDLPRDSEKPFNYSNHLLSPKPEDVPSLNLSGLSGPCKFEYNTQESKCSNNEEVEDDLPRDSEKPFNYSNHLLSPKPEDVPSLNLSGLSGPCKFEYNTQESKCSNNEEFEDDLPRESEKPFNYSNYLLSPKPEDVPSLNLSGLSGPCKFEYDTQESKCSNNEGVIVSIQWS
ncbi:uncharacterized protein LOC136037837 isoform X2 [Artemia franciscana]|uniref:uncharacterized protein LOC136037837 isoform X2 n=1 Tax=Artemia franciscana TaxID=6661 RepID=UPI0032DB33D8